MDDRRRQKNSKQYNKINRAIQREIQEAKEKWTNEWCKDIEALEKKDDRRNMPKNNLHSGYALVTLIKLH